VGDNLVAVLLEVVETVIERNGVGVALGHGIGQRHVEVGTVQIAVTGAELRHERIGVRSPLQLAAVGCAADEVARRISGLLGQGWAYPEEIQDAHGVRRDGDARADLPEGPGLLEDAHRHAEMLQRQGGRQTTDPGADDRDRAVMRCARLG